MKAIIGALVISYLFMACGSSEVRFDQLDIQYDGEVATYQQKGETFTGVALEGYPNIVYHHHIVNGLEQKEEAFYPTGEKEREFPMKDGRKEGLCRMWYKSGQLQLEETYKNGVLHGTAKT